jgi:hypothetical protein
MSKLQVKESTNINIYIKTFFNIIRDMPRIRITRGHLNKRAYTKSYSRQAINSSYTYNRTILVHL